jgi:ABC-type iron transport system FetAB permease component
MRLTINVDLTPQEARAFFGMPDVEPLNEMVVNEMMVRAKDQMDTLADPERFVARWMEMGGKGLDAFQGLVGAAMNAASAPAKKK